MTYYRKTAQPGLRPPLPFIPALRPAAPPAAASPLDPVDFALRLGFTPDPIQQDLLRCLGRRVLLNCSRQWGKSTITAIRALWHAVTHPAAMTVIVAPSARQSGELLMKIEPYVSALGWQPRGDGLNENSLMLPNGSRIVALPQMPTTIRGVSAVSFLVIDEAAQVSEDMYRAVRPMLATTGGDLWMLSTPFGKRGFFYESWTNGGHQWHRVIAPATECPRISKEFLDEERAACGDDYIRQEYLCEFIDSVAGMFDRDAIEEAFTADVEELKW